MSMLTAGMTHGMLQHLGLPTDISAVKGLGGHAANQGVSAAVKVGSDLATTGRVDGVAVSLSAVAGTLAGYLSNKIGTWYKGSNGTMVEAIAHKTMHALNGAGAGIIIGGEKGLTAGALGAVVAETVADIMTPTGGLDHLPKDQRPDLSPEKTRLTQATARLVAGMVAFSAGMTADQIGVAYGEAHIDGLTHKIMHATTGAFVGVRGDPMAGAAAGALGAFVAETYKLGVIDFAKNNFNVKLDSLHQSLLKDHSSDELSPANAGGS